MGCLTHVSQLQTTKLFIMHYFSSFLILSRSYIRTVHSIQLQSNYLLGFRTMVCVIASDEGKYPKFHSQDSVCFSCIRFTNSLSPPKEHNFLYHAFHQMPVFSQGIYIFYTNHFTNCFSSPKKFNFLYHSYHQLPVFSQGI